MVNRGGYATPGGQQGQPCNVQWLKRVAILTPQLSAGVAMPPERVNKGGHKPSGKTHGETADEDRFYLKYMCATYEGSSTCEWQCVHAGSRVAHLCET